MKKTRVFGAMCHEKGSLPMRHNLYKQWSLFVDLRPSFVIYVIDHLEYICKGKQNLHLNITQLN